MAGGRIEVEIAPNLDRFGADLQSGLKSQTGLASSLGKGLGLAIAGGVALAGVGLSKVIDLGNQYVGNLNELQAVTQATGVEMARVGQIAEELGSDLSLPGTSAADAAAAMKELAKGGLDVNEAMTAAKGTLQLAAAAQVDAAQAAEIQSDALNQFGLAASEAGHVADVLANTANAASGEITDMANALKYVGPVAKSIGVNIDNVATAIGLVATQGIRGEQAGTSLRGMLASLAAPSKPAAAALRDLGIEAFTAEGKFIGLRGVTEQLAAAKGRMSEAAFIEAAAVAFGNEGMTIASALASTGAVAFDDMAKAVSRSGGAAEVAAAKTQGLGGAWDGLQSQLETVGIGIYDAIDGPLERLVRSSAARVEDLGEAVIRGLETAIAVGEVYGPRLAEAIKSRGAVLANAGRDVLLPLAQGSVEPLNEAVNTGIGLWDDFTGVLDNAVEGARPVAEGIGAITSAAADGDGPVSAVAAGVGLLGDAARVASVLLVPLGKAVGVIADAFAALPGPVQTAVVAMGLLAAFRNPLSNLGQTMRDRVTAPFIHFNETLRLQQALLTGSSSIASAQVGNMGLAFAALEARVPVIGRMAESFRNASTAAQGFVTNQAALVQTASGISGQYTGAATALGKTEGALRAVAGTAAGTAAALGTGLKAAATGLVGAIGGPFGLALAGATVGLALLAGRQQEAAAEASAHSSRIDGLAAALRESNGAINESVRAHQAQALQADKVGDSERSVADAAREAGISLADLTEATLGNGDALDSVRAKLQAIVEANTSYSTSAAGARSGRVNDIVTLNDQGEAAQALLNDINGLSDEFGKAQQKERELTQAIREGRASMLDATDSGRSLSSAMSVLADETATADDRARALRDALDALSGGTVSLEAAQAKVHEQIARLSDVFRTNGTEAEIAARNAKGFGEALLNVDGSINTASENGRKLFDSLRDLSGQMADVSQKTYDVAISQGATIPEAMAKAVAAAEGVRNSFVSQHDQMGLNITQAEALANRYGLVPSDISTLIHSPGMDQTQRELIVLKALVDQVPPDKPITVRSLSDEAKAKLIDLGYTVTTTPNNVTITANSTAARQELDRFLSTPATKTVTVVYTGGKSLGIGSAVNHDGNYLKAYASGGFNRLTPMAAGVASVVPPNTWRVVGDRMTDDEAYIPINSSWRSQQILARTASEMGFDLIRRFAVGGIAGTTATTSGGTSSRGVSTVEKHFHLAVYEAGNTSVDLRAQFARLELMSGM